MDRQTDRQTDGRAIAYSALSMLSRAKNGERNVAHVPGYFFPHLVYKLLLTNVATVLTSLNRYRVIDCRNCNFCHDLCYSGLFQQ